MATNQAAAEAEIRAAREASSMPQSCQMSEGRVMAKSDTRTAVRVFTSTKAGQPPFRYWPGGQALYVKVIATALVVNDVP